MPFDFFFQNLIIIKKLILIFKMINNILNLFSEKSTHNKIYDNS
jgi:hypothetical protein